jgi:hypothetical protein
MPKNTQSKQEGPSRTGGKPGKELSLEVLDHLPPVGATHPNPEAQLAQQLTDQYHRATGGMVEVLRFGAMMMQLREGIVSTRGHVATGGAKSKDSGIKGWLEKHCPDIKRETAYRLEAVTKAVAEQYAKIVGPKVAKRFALQDLVTMPAESLPEDIRAKQLLLFDYVSGTSQRSWWERLSPKSKGGKTYDRDGTKGKIRPLTIDEKRDALKRLNAETGGKISQLCDFKSYVAADEAELDGLEDHFTEGLKQLKAWRKLTTAQREAALLEVLEK